MIIAVACAKAWLLTLGTFPMCCASVFCNYSCGSHQHWLCRSSYQGETWSRGETALPSSNSLACINGPYYESTLISTREMWTTWMCPLCYSYHCPPTFTGWRSGYGL